METISKRTFVQFKNTVKKARAIKALPDLHHHDLEHYCQTLINAASVAHQLACMECSDRIDLAEPEGVPSASDTLNLNFQQFARNYLGLDLMAHGDPSGAVWKLVVPETLGDSFGDRTHLCVPCNDAYFCA